MSYKWTWKMPKWFQKLYAKHWNNCDLLNGGDRCTCNKPSTQAKMEVVVMVQAGTAVAATVIQLGIQKVIWRGF